jgi:hypothetical protein
MIYDHTLHIHDGVQPVAFDVIAEVSDDDYSWSSSAVLRRQADGALFYVEDGGCSCNSFGDDLSVADLKPIHSFSEALLLAGADRERLQRSYDQKGSVEYR